MGKSEKIKIECGKFKFECEGEVGKIMDAGIEALKQHKKVIELAY
ncbi:MAG: hypothetical protein ACOWW1_05660 [archaeon]|jgi:hypothetical protein